MTVWESVDYAVEKRLPVLNFGSRVEHITDIISYSWEKAGKNQLWRIAGKLRSAYVLQCCMLVTTPCQFHCDVAQVCAVLSAV